MDIGTKLKSLRIEKKIEPQEMALKLAISENTYRRYERNETTPDINMLEKIAQVLDKSFLDLLPEGIVFNNIDQKGGNFGQYVSVSEKLIEQFELRLKEKDKLIEQYEFRVQEKDMVIELLRKETKSLK